MIEEFVMKECKTKSAFLPFSCFFLLTFTACNYGGINFVPESSSTASLGLAEQFAFKLNRFYSSDYANEFTLIKEYGVNGPNFVVFYDNFQGQYDAFNLSLYSPGMSINGYLSSSRAKDVIRNLQPLGGGLYYSSDSNVIYEESKRTPKKLAKANYILEAQKMKGASRKIAAEFGLSEKRAFEIAKLTFQWNSLQGKKTLTEADVSSFSRELLGFDLNTAKTAYKKSLSGDKKALDDLFAKAAETNDTTPEKMKKNFNDLLQN
jgi:hypothetical protein